MKRQRENRSELEEEIGAINVKIVALEGEKAEWKTKAEAAEKAGSADEAKEHLGQLASVQQQLASLQNRLYLKEAALVADESMVKREKGTDLGNAFVCPLYFLTLIVIVQIGLVFFLGLYASLLQQQRVL